MNIAQNEVVANAGFEIDAFDPVDGIIKDPTFNCSVIEDAEGNAVSGFIIVGKNSAICQAASNKVRVGNLVRQSNRKKSVDTTTVEGAQIVVNNMIENEETVALAVVVGWFGFLSEGQPAQFDPNKAAKMIKARPTWRSKILAELEKDANFPMV